VARGDSLFSESKYADAELNYRKAIQKDAKFGLAYYKLGLTLIKRDQGLAAHQALSQAVQLVPNNVDAKIALADVAFSFYFTDPRRPKALYDEIQRLASEILTLKSDSPDGYRLKGAMALLDLKPKEAVESYQKANGLRPGSGDIVVGYIQALLKSGRQKEAEDLAIGFLGKNQTFAPVYDVLQAHYLGTNRPADAERVLKLWVDNNPSDSTAVLRMAGYYLRWHKTAEMNAVLNRLGNLQSFPRGRIVAGDFYAESGNWSEAIDQYERGVQNDPKNSSEYKRRIVAALVAQGKRDDALNLLDTLIRELPKDTDARLSRARLWLDSGKPDKLESALTELKTQAKERPNDALLHYDIGRGYLLKEDATAARSSFREAAQIRQDWLPARYQLAQLAFQQQDLPEVLRYAEEILKIKPGDPVGRLLRAEGLMGTNRLAEARNELRMLLKDYPGYRDAAVQMGLLAINERNFNVAEDIFRKLAGTKEGDVRGMVGLAGAYSSQKQYDKAIQILTDELKKSPGNDAVTRMLGLTALEAKRYPLAIENLRSVAASNPKSVSDQVNLAESYRLSGDETKSVEVLENAKGADSKDPAALMVLATAFYNNGRLGDARDIVSRVVQLQPDNPGALNALAFAITETGGDLNEAQKLIQRALQRDANNSSAKDTLGWIYLKTNRADDALQIFSNLVDKNPEEPSFHYHLGAALAKKGEGSRARAELQIALSKKPQALERKSIETLLADLK
jgi:tetratricopeptide (TPR) repeat protein